MAGRAGPEPAGPQGAVSREVLKDAVAAAGRAVAVPVAVPVARQAGRVVLAVAPEAMVPRGPSVRAAPSEPRFVFSAARLSRRGGASRALLLPRRGHPPVEVGRDRSGF